MSKKIDQHGVVVTFRGRVFEGHPPPVGDRLTKEQLGDLIMDTVTDEPTVLVGVDVVSALVDEVIEYRNLEGVEDLRTRAREKERAERLASFRRNTGLTDEQAVEGMKNGTLVEPFYAEWMVLLGRPDVLAPASEEPVK